jgi:hypothetical protein
MRKYPGSFADRRAFEKFKFYKHMRIYLIFNLIFFFFSARNGRGMTSLSIAFFWGIGLAMHYLTVFHPWGSRTLSREWERRRMLEEGHDSPDDEYLELKQLKPTKKKRWDERDLV